MSFWVRCAPSASMPPSIDMKTPSKSSKLLSEFDPLSAENLQRAADPWWGNTLCVSTDADESQPGTPVAASEHKATLPTREDDIEWDEFRRALPPSCVTTPIVPLDDAFPPFPVVAKLSDAATRRRVPLKERFNESGTEEEYEDDEDVVESESRTDSDEKIESIDSGSQRFSWPQPANNKRRQSLTETLFQRFPSLRRLSASFGATQDDDLPPRNYDSYDVTFERAPIGLEFETDWYGQQAIVKGFKRVGPNNDEIGPAERCGIIRIGDVLTSINGLSCLELSFADTLQRLRIVGCSQHTLHFTSLEAAGDLSIYAKTHEPAILEAKGIVHESKTRFYRPPPPSESNEVILGCIERLCGATVTSFHFHREDTGQFLLACSCVNERTGPFIFHTLQDAHLRNFEDLPQDEDAAAYLGRMEPNFLGTELTLYDHHQFNRHQLGFIEFEHNVLGRVPNYLKVAFPRPIESEAGNSTNESEENEEGDDLDTELRMRSLSGMGSDYAIFHVHEPTDGVISERFKRLQQTRSITWLERLRTLSDSLWSSPRSSPLASKTRSTAVSTAAAVEYNAIEQHEYASDLVTMETKPPAWNDMIGAWTLNFNGRVKLASKKNFMLIAERGNEPVESDSGDDVVYLRFGKVTRTRFALDYQAPLSPFLALAIACSSFVYKIVVT